MSREPVVVKDPNPYSFEEEERNWPEAMLGPPPWRLEEEDWEADSMDVAVGKFVRALPLFEVALMLTREAISPGPSFVGVHHDGPEQAIKAIEDALPHFPANDQIWAGVTATQSRVVLDLRNAVVHGMWHDTDRPGVFLSERPLRRSDAKRMGLSQLPDEEYPTKRREFNAGGVMAGWARARWVSNYLVPRLDRWRTHFAADT